MKGTSVEGSIKNLFEGSLRSYMQCINVNFKSERTETYYDIQLDVKGCKCVNASFAQFCKEEILGKIWSW